MIFFFCKLWRDLDKEISGSKGVKNHSLAVFVENVMNVVLLSLDF